MLRRLVLHVSRYTGGSLLVTVASVISFPIFTRLFTVAEYGTLSLISSTLLLMTGVGKMGIQHSIVRFYAEVMAGKQAVTESQFFSTVVIGLSAIATFVTLAVALVCLVIPTDWWDDRSAPRLMMVASLLILIRVIDSGLLNILRAEQRSALYNSYAVIRKYAGLAGVLAILFYLVPGLPGFFFGTIVTEGIGLMVLFWIMFRRELPSTAKFSRGLFFAMLAFGLPMFGTEISFIFLNIGGRYVIQWKAGAEMLGTYSAAYNFCDYVQSILTMSFAQAVGPIYFKLWEEKGKEATQTFLAQTIRFYMILALGVLAGMSAISSEALTVLASQRYQAGAVLIPWVIGGMLLHGGIPLFSAGIFLTKQTNIILVLVIISAVINIVLTALLLPHWGLTGVGVATLAGYLFYAVAAERIGRRSLELPFPWLDLAKFSLLALAMYWAVRSIHIGTNMADVILRIVAGSVIYAILILAADRPARILVRSLATRWMAARTQ